MTITLRLAGKGLLAGVAAAGAILACAPIASAEDPPPGEQCPPQEAPSSEEQQCEEPQSAPGMPGMPEMPDNSNNGNPQQAPEQAPQQKPQQGDLADKNCWVVNGVPYWNAPGTAPRATGPGDVVSWCPTTYGLTPH
jgi:hypothetical protein